MTDPQDKDELVPGTHVGNYVVDRVIGTGGGGIVYAARHRVLGRRVAVKVLREEMTSHAAMVARFEREAAAVNRIQHPNIVDIHEFGEFRPGRPYYVMELLEGMDLRKLLIVHGRFSPQEVLGFVEPICSAVQAAHEAGIVHRDIKASNVLVIEREGGASTIKLLDFGIAKLIQSESAGQGLTEPGAMVGTASHMAPEQVRCERVDARTDIYALGVLIFQLLTGRYPFESEDPKQVAMLHLHAPAPRPSAFAAVSPAVDEVVLRCLEKRAAARFGSARELVEALRKALGAAPPASNAGASAAVGMHVEVRTTHDDDLDDATIEDMANVLDTVERYLAGVSSFAFPLRTSASLLAVRVVPDGVDPDVEQGAVEAAAAHLRAILADREGRHPAVEVVVSVSLGRVQWRAQAGSVEIVDGPLLDVRTWSGGA